jgi:phage terminase small subunit
MARELAKLDDRQRAFVRAYVNGGGNAEAAALEAGYESSSARIAESVVTREPAILAAIQVELGRAIARDAIKARQVLSEVQSKDQATGSDKIKADIALKLLGLAGHVAPRAHAPADQADKSLHEMTVEELKQQRDRLEGEIAGRAKAINAPSDPRPNADAAEMLA